MNLHRTVRLACCGMFQHSTHPRGEARWPSGRASDSGARGRGFDPHSGRRVVSLSKIHIPPTKELVIPRKRSLRPDMTEKLLTGT